MLPWPDVKVASKLCVGGPCKYALKEKAEILDSWLLEQVMTSIAGVFDQQTALVLSFLLLWAVYDDGQVAAVCPEISSRIKAVYNRLSSRCHQQIGENPVKKLLLVASRQEDEVHLGKISNLDADVVHHVVGHGCGCGYGCGCAEQQQSTERIAHLAGLGADLNERTLALYAMVSASKHCLVELQNAQMQPHHSISRRLGLLECNTRRMALQPVCCIQQEYVAVAADNEEEGD
eukprot:4854643-Ditylum_brightwellii.AAC.1